MTTKKIFLLSVLVLGVNAAAIAARHYCNSATETALKTAINDAGNGDTVIVNPLLAWETITLTNSTSVPYGRAYLVIEKSLTIMGNCVILQGRDKAAIIYAKGNINLNYMFLFDGNNDYGGAIMHDGGNLTATNCYFKNIRSALSYTSGNWGGAVYTWRGNDLTLNNCTFENCQGYAGGAIHLYYTMTGICTLNNNIFIGCSASLGNIVYCPRNKTGYGSGNRYESDANNFINFVFSDADNDIFSGDIITWEVGSPVASAVTASYSFSQKTLTIAGTGAMKDFAVYSPWSAFNLVIYIAVIEGNVTSIGKNAFNNCLALRQVRLPNSKVTNIGENAFAGCIKLGHIFLTRDNPPTLNTTAFDGLDKSKIGVFVPAPDMYRANSSWQGFSIVDAYCADCN